MTDKLPRICFVALQAYPLLAGDDQTPLIGGAELQQVMLAKRLLKLGYPVSMICLDFGQEDGIEIDGVEVFRAYRPHEGIPVLRFWWPRLTRIWGCLRRADADIYYQRAASVLTGIVAAYCKYHNKKSIFAAAGNPNFEKSTSRIRYERDKWIYEYGLRNVDRIFVQNQEQAELCRANFGRESILVPNFYDGPSTEESSNSSEILWVSTIRHLKRPNLFLDMAAALPQYQFKMIGGAGSGAGENKLFEDVRSRAEKLRNVTFLGFVPYTEIDRHFRTADIFVNTSESEGFPNTFLQAWAHGVPTVAFVDCGARIHGHRTGLRVKTADQMIGEIQTLMSNDCLRIREGSACRRFVAMHHSWNNVFPVYERTFRELCPLDRC